MFAFTQSISRLQNILLIDFHVKDLSKTNEIIESIWEFINQIVYTEKDILLQCLDEYSRVFKYNSYFQQNDLSSMDEVSNLSELLLMDEVSIQDLLLGNHYQSHGGGVGVGVGVGGGGINVHDFIYQTRKTFDKNKLNIIILGEKLPKFYSNQPSTIIKDSYYNFEYQILDFDCFPIKEEFPLFYILQHNRFISLTHEELDQLIDDSKNHNCSFLMNKIHNLNYWIILKS